MTNEFFAGEGACGLQSILKMAVQNRFVRRHLFVKMAYFSDGDRSKSLLIPDVDFAYSSVGKAALSH
jgi:hypothetical protein